MRIKYSKNAQIGLAFIAALIMVYFGVNFLKGVNILKKQNQYYALFDDVSKLLISSPVYVKGYQIGLISKIGIISEKPMRFVVGVNLSENIRIPQGSHLEYGLDLFGASTVNLVMAQSDVYLQRGDTLTGKREAGLMDGVTAVMPKTDSILLRVDSLICSLNKIVANPAWEESIKGVGRTVEQLNSASVSLNKMIGSLEQDIPEISRNLASVSSDLKKVSTGLSEMDMEGTFTSVDETVNNLKQLTAKINSDDNSLGLLLNDTKLHDNINETIGSVTELLEDIRRNPSRYLTVRLRLF
ncbi:MAG: MlaD family protein [Proteiniphilum sp.]|jgi:phospholipid/cholesterol/gamma-HCH transport system substrate-binding protein|nr:MlaD family protein [Proteiniphilum sp.]